MSLSKYGVDLTVRNLYYLLGNISHKWRHIGVQLGIAYSEVEKIAKDFESSDRQLIELFGGWLDKSVDCNWPTIIKALEKMKEITLAENISDYLKELNTSQGRESTDEVILFPGRAKQVPAFVMQAAKKMKFSSTSRTFAIFCAFLLNM